MKSWIVYTTDSENKAKTSNVINPLCKPNPFLFFAVPWHFLNLMTLTRKPLCLRLFVIPAFLAPFFEAGNCQRPEKRTKNDTLPDPRVWEAKLGSRRRSNFLNPNSSEGTRFCSETPEKNAWGLVIWNLFTSSLTARDPENHGGP